MAFCRNCGHKLADGANFCDGCGTRVGEVEQKEERKVSVKPYLQTKYQQYLLEYMQQLYTTLFFLPVLGY